MRIHTHTHTHTHSLTHLLNLTHFHPPTLTPSQLLSPEDMRSRPTHRPRAQDLEHPTSDLPRPHRERDRGRERERLESPPPPPPSFNYLLHRSQRPSKSVRGEDSENESGNEYFPPHAQPPALTPSARRVCKHCRVS